jgi:hypothetical protein
MRPWNFRHDFNGLSKNLPDKIPCLYSPPRLRAKIQPEETETWDKSCLETGQDLIRGLLKQDGASN